MRVLILGASGYLGQTVAHHLGKDHEVYGTYHAQATRYGDRNNMFQLDLGDTYSMRAIYLRTIGLW
jgi:nucleoside-diphosphate-sugar epimerase